MRDIEKRGPFRFPFSAYTLSIWRQKARSLSLKIIELETGERGLCSSARGKKGALERLLAAAAAERLTEELQTCGKEIYGGTGVLIGTVDGFTVEQTEL